MDTMTHEAPAMSLADMPTTDEGTIDFRRLAVRLVGQRLNAAMKMTAEGLGGRAPERLPRAQAQDPQAQGGRLLPQRGAQALLPHRPRDGGRDSGGLQVGAVDPQDREAAAYVHTMPRISCPRIPSAVPYRRVIML